MNASHRVAAGPPGHRRLARRLSENSLTVGHKAVEGGPLERAADAATQSQLSPDRPMP